MKRSLPIKPWLLFLLAGLALAQAAMAGGAVRAEPIESDIRPPWLGPRCESSGARP